LVRRLHISDEIRRGYFKTGEEKMAKTGKKLAAAKKLEKKQTLIVMGPQ
jgi:hypothetical protein